MLISSCSIQIAVSGARPEFAQLCAPLFSRPGRPLLEGALDLTGRIFKDFIFDSKADGKVSNTRYNTFFEKRRRGLLFRDLRSILQIACLRSIGIPGALCQRLLAHQCLQRGRPRLIGADCFRHAWCSGVGAMEPVGWVDFDPTNNCVPSDGHITVAWGARLQRPSARFHGVLLGRGSGIPLHVGRRCDARWSDSSTESPSLVTEIAVSAN